MDDLVIDDRDAFGIENLGNKACLKTLAGKIERDKPNGRRIELKLIERKY